MVLEGLGIKGTEVCTKDLVNCSSDCALSHPWKLPSHKFKFWSFFWRYAKLLDPDRFTYIFSQVYEFQPSEFLNYKQFHIGFQLDVTYWTASTAAGFARLVFTEIATYDHSCVWTLPASILTVARRRSDGRRGLLRTRMSWSWSFHPFFFTSQTSPCVGLLVLGQQSCQSVHWVLSLCRTQHCLYYLVKFCHRWRGTNHLIWCPGSGW